MAKPINHGVISSVATVGVETGKGAIGGVALFGGLGALTVGGLAAAIGLFWPLVVAAAVVGGIGGIVAGGSVGAVGGGILGAFRGGSRVTSENSAFALAMNGPEELANARLAGVQQQAYVAGVQDGQARLMQEIQAAQQANFVQREDARRAAAAQANPVKTV